MQLVRLSLAAVSLAGFIVACGGSPKADRTLDILPELPTGQFSGTPWTMNKATVKRSTSADGGSTLDVKLFGTEVADCATSSSDAGYIIFKMPAVVGSRALQLSLSDLSSAKNQTITFVTPPSSNNIAVDGIINLTELSESSVTMGLLAKGGKTTDVNGTFTATFCQ